MINGLKIIMRKEGEGDTNRAEQWWHTSSIHVDFLASALVGL